MDVCDSCGEEVQRPKRRVYGKPLFCTSCHVPLTWSEHYQEERKHKEVIDLGGEG